METALLSRGRRQRLQRFVRRSELCFVDRSISDDPCEWRDTTYPPAAMGPITQPSANDAACVEIYRHRLARSARKNATTSMGSLSLKHPGRGRPSGPIASRTTRPQDWSPTGTRRAMRVLRSHTVIVSPPRTYARYQLNFAFSSDTFTVFDMR